MFVRLELQIAKNEISGSVFVLRGKELLPQIGKLLSGYFLLSLLSSFSTVPGSSVRSVSPASRKENIIGRRFSLCCIENGKGKDGWDRRKADGKEKLNKTFSQIETNSGRYTKYKWWSCSYFWHFGKGLFAFLLGRAVAGAHLGEFPGIDSSVVGGILQVKHKVHVPGGIRSGSAAVGGIDEEKTKRNSLFFRQWKIYRILLCPSSRLLSVSREQNEWVSKWAY